MVNIKDVPTGVKIISILYYIGAAFSVIFGVLFFVGARAIGFIANQIPLLGLPGAGFFIVIGTILIGLGVLCIFIGRGLRKGQSWARIVAIILACLGILLRIIGMTQGNISSNIVGLVINLVVGGYLLFSKAVKGAFA